jgi:hypothetical protein
MSSAGAKGRLAGKAAVVTGGASEFASLLDDAAAAFGRKDVVHNNANGVRPPDGAAGDPFKHYIDRTVNAGSSAVTRSVPVSY